jgi:hypothetical protein
MTAGFMAPRSGDPAWLSTVRAHLASVGPHLAWEGDDGIETLLIPEGFTRIGRGLRADVRLGCRTVSRRHALVHRAGTTCVALDDHSLIGVFVNGKRIDWQPLMDGDQLEVGRFRIYFVGARQPHRIQPDGRTWHSPASLP